MPLGTAFQTLLAANYNSFFLTGGMIGVGIYSIEGGRYIKYLILVLEICMVTAVIVKGRVLLEIPSMYTLVQYFQSLYRNEDIYELEGVHIANFEAQAAQTLWEFVGI